MLKKLTTLTAVLLMATACANNGPGLTKQDYGAVGGAIAGGVLGAQFGKGTGQLVATGVGTMLGLMVGSEIGKSLDKADQVYADRAYQRAETAPIGETISWNNPQSGNSGTVTPTRDGISSTGLYCREFQQTVVIDGRSEIMKGTACRNADGTWQMQ